MCAQSVLGVESAALLVIDFQDRLVRVMYEREKLVDNVQRLIKGVQVLGVPIIATEQYPQGLGSTIPEVAQFFANVQPIPKLSFSCCEDERFLKEFKALNLKQILVVGIESHVCVYQTAIDLLNAGYEVQVVSDCVSSRTVENREIGLQRISCAGARLTSVEMALFELLRVARGDKFKEISQIVK